MANQVIILVEDESLVAEVLSTGLEDAGFPVDVFRDPHLALVNLTKQPERYVALVTDIDFGCDMNGWDLAQSARGVIDDLPVVYMTAGISAYDRRPRVKNGLLLGKPFPPAVLVAAVLAVISLKTPHSTTGRHEPRS